MPARHAVAEPRRLLPRRLVVLRSKPIRTRHFGHAAEQSFFRATANQKLVTARHDKRRATAQVPGLLGRFARKALLIAAPTRRAGIRKRAQAARRAFRRADRGA